MTSARRTDLGRVSPADRDKMRVFAESMKHAELPVGEMLEGAELAHYIRWVNERRAKIGVSPIPVWEDEIEDKPAMIMWRRGQALGMVQRRR